MVFKLPDFVREIAPPLSRRFSPILLDPRRLALLEAASIGFVSGLAAVALKQGVNWLGGLRVQTWDGIPLWLKLPLFGAIGGAIAGWLVQQYSPNAIGSGISHVKAELASSRRSQQAIALNLRLAIVKLVSTILVAGSGLPLGRQGPTVHVGAALAASMSRWIPTSPAYRRQTIAAGAAAGLAAGFNAPIAGVLFVVEELLHDVSSLTLGTAILASFIGAVVSRALGGSPWTVQVDPTQALAQFDPSDIPFLVVLGVLTGIMASLFDRGIVASVEWQRRYLKIGLAGRMAVVGLISGGVLASLPQQFHDNARLRELLSEGYGTGAMDLGWQFVAIAFLVKFALTVLTYGTGAPGGLFAPTLVLGSALGGLVGSISLGLFETGDPHTYALAGMGAFFGAVSKVPITAIVIVFEITQDFNLVLPLMIVSVLAYVVAEQFSSGSLYDRLLELRGLSRTSLEEEERTLAELTAGQVMERRVETLDSTMPLQEVLAVFARSPHRGFPVMENARLVGMITHTDLRPPASRSLPDTTPLSELMSAPPVIVRPEEPIARVLYLLDRHHIGRLPVVDGRRLVGLVTRSDIIEAESRQLEGRAKRYAKVEPSYPVYVTRDPAVGRGRVLVPLANPQTAPLLLRFAAAIASAKDYELECLQVVPVPHHRCPSETAVRTTQSRRLLQVATRIGRQWEVPVHTQIRVAHDVGAAVLETIRDRHIDKLVMGWKGGTRTPGRIFGDVADTLLRQAPCEVVLVKWGASALRAQETPIATFENWLVPIGGGANALAGLELLSALVALGRYPAVRLCQVFPSAAQDLETEFLERTAKLLEAEVSCPVYATPIYGASVAEAVLEVAQRYEYDAIVVGASRQGVLQQTLHGNIPREIARGTTRCTTIVVRNSISGTSSRMR